MVEIVAIFLFLILLVLSAVGARRMMLSRSTNVILYAGFSAIAALSAGMLFYSTLQGDAGLVQAVIAVATLQAGWLFMRGLSRAQHSARRDDDYTYRPRQKRDVVQFKSVRA